VAHHNTQEAAVKRGADDLESLVEWVLRDRPEELARAQRDYQEFCLRLYRKIQRGQRVREAA
jgi:hypothetical protein